MPINWDPALAVGVSDIDSQHQEIFKRANELLSAVDHHSGKGQVGLLLEFLARYVKSHFAAEEGLMRKHNYPAMTEHMAQHQKFVADFQALRQRHATEGTTPEVVTALTDFVVRWLIDHIGTSDRRLGEYVKSKSKS